MLWLTPAHYYLTGHPIINFGLVTCSAWRLRADYLPVAPQSWLLPEEATEEQWRVEAVSQPSMHPMQPQQRTGS